jgi:uncharacterized protein (DUF427 family)
MSVRMRDVLSAQLDQLRHEPTDKWIRALLDGRTVVDTKSAMLVWEPKRVVPTYAVPDADLAADLVPVTPDDGPTPAGVPAMGAPELEGRTVYDPSIPFSVHTVDGEALEIHARGTERTVAAFRPTDPDLAGYVLVDFDGFDAWFEEDEPNLAHPRDPFHRVEVLHSSRPVRVEVGGVVIAESASPYMLFEPPLPVRYYFAPGEVRADLLDTSDTVTRCAYKGEANYWSAAGEPDIAWGYQAPLRDAAEIAGRIAFFNERVDVYVDGILQERVVTPWSRRD